MDHQGVNLLLLSDIEADKSWFKMLVDIVDSLETSLAVKAILVFIAQLKSFVDARRGS